MAVELVDVRQVDFGKIVAKYLRVMRNDVKPLIQLQKILLVAVVLLVSFSLSGCSFLKDKNPKITEPRSMRMGATACLKDTKTIFRNYVNGTESVDRVEEALDCLVKAVDTFTSKTKGQSSAAGYTLEEIQRFIIDYFEDKNSFSTRLLSIGFEIKSTAIGGRSNNITRVEIEKVKEIILELKSGVRELDPHMDILLGRLAPSEQVSAPRIKKAVEALNKFTAKLSAKFEGKDGGSLGIKKIFELVKTLKGPELSAKFEQYLLVATNLKGILINGPKNKIRCDEWSAVLKASSRLYGLMLSYKYGLSEQKIGKGETIPVVSSVMDEVASLLRDGAARSDNGMISSESLNELLLNYEKINGHIFKGIKSSSLETIYPKIFTHVLRPSRISAFPNNVSIERGRQLGIGKLEVTALQYYSLNYITGLTVARNLFKDRSSRSASDLVAELRQDLATIEKDKPKSPQNVARWITHKLVIKTFLNVLNPAHRPLLYARVNAPNPEANLGAPFVGRTDYNEAQYTHDDLIRLNTTRLIVELVLRSFTVDTNRARNVGGLTSDEAEALYRDMRKVGFDLGAADPRSQRAGHRTFMEANLFMSSSDGNDYISYREGVEWFNFVSASGAHSIEIFNSAYAQWLAAPNDGLRAQDVFGRVKVDIISFRSHFRNNFGRYFSNLPGMAHFVEQLKKQKRNCKDKKQNCGGSLDSTMYGKFEESLENASRPLGHTNASMDSSAMRTVVPILYYTESIFNRHDKNQNGILENDEAWKIFPIMKNTINDVSNGAANTEWKQKMVFARLLLTGEPPPDDWRKYFSTPMDTVKEWWKAPKLNRLDIINLISAIATTSRANAVKAIKGIYEAKKGTIHDEFQSGSVVILDQLHELSRCSPDSVERFRWLMRANARFVFAPPTAKGEQYNGDTFVRRLQMIIQRDQAPSRSDRIVPPTGLHEQCQHMLRL